MMLENVEMNMAADSNSPGASWSLPLEISCAARSNLCVLLSGPPETVEDLAYRIHSVSGWRHGEFLMIDCGRNDALLERLFGPPLADDAAVRTGTPGVRLVQAGTVFLQEVGRLGLDLQDRLAVHLAAQRVEGRHGRSRWRLIASTSESLFDRVNAGTFRDRLFYRLNMIHLALPPL